MLLLESPVLTNARVRARCATTWATRVCAIDCTFAVAGRRGAACASALERIRARGRGRACAAAAPTSILTDEAQSAPTAPPIPMILAAGARAHASGARSGLRTFTSLNVRSAECLDVHYFAVLIGVGATTVNAYLAQESIADRHRRGLFGELSLGECRRATTRRRSTRAC